MGRPKQPKEYFLERIRKFYVKTGRVPKSGDFSGPFNVNVANLFGGWGQGVKAALNIDVKAIRMTEDERLQPVRDFYALHNRFPNSTELPYGKSIYRFGGYKTMIEKAIGIDVYLLILQSLHRLTTDGVESASGAEIHQDLKVRKINMDRPLSSRLIQDLLERDLVSRYQGDRIRLYRITSNGHSYLNNKKGKKDEHRT